MRGTSNTSNNPLVVTTMKSKLRVMDSDFHLYQETWQSTAGSYYTYIDMGFRPTWRVE